MVNAITYLFIQSSLRYIYNGQPYLATVQFGLPSLVFCVFSLGLAVGVVIAVGMLLIFQLRSIVRNRTGIEDWILEKAKYRREDSGEEFIFPYDLGVKRNIQQVASWSCAPIGDGIVWEINDKCDQYTLTVGCCFSYGLEHLIHLKFYNFRPSK